MHCSTLVVWRHKINWALTPSVGALNSGFGRRQESARTAMNGHVTLALHPPCCPPSHLTPSESLMRSCVPRCLIGAHCTLDWSCTLLGLSHALCLRHPALLCTLLCSCFLPLLLLSCCTNYIHILLKLSQLNHATGLPATVPVYMIILTSHIADGMLMVQLVCPSLICAYIP